MMPRFIVLTHRVKKSTDLVVCATSTLSDGRAQNPLTLPLTSKPNEVMIVRNIAPMLEHIAARGNVSRNSRIDNERSSLERNKCLLISFLDRNL